MDRMRFFGDKQPGFQYLRNSSGCQDTSVDGPSFVVMAPFPRAGLTLAQGTASLPQDRRASGRARQTIPFLRVPDHPAEVSEVWLFVPQVAQRG